MLGAQQLDAEELGLAGLVRRMLRRPVLAADRAAMSLRTVPTCRERLGQHHGRARNLGVQAGKRAHERAQVEVQRERRAGAGAEMPTMGVPSTMAKLEWCPGPWFV